jgi:pyrimidine-nucleoside phosphorylase
MRTVDLVRKKRDGRELSADELSFLIRGYTAGDIPDYQVAAWLMAVCWHGMTLRETTDLTLALARSGEMVDLGEFGPTSVDKHSTGGVGDKTTLVVGPLVAAAGVPVPKLSGRALGFTGGTLDKLESIPGFRANLTPGEFRANLARVGLVIASQSADLAPADGKLYALRDVTATVASVPLIASSVMSKKLAAGAGAIVLDVKVGRGAFMKTTAEAWLLAETMVEIGRGADRRVAAIVSDMSQPLGQAVGNALEVREAVETLQGDGPADLVELCRTIAGRMLLATRAAADEVEAYRRVEEVWRSGQALAKLAEFVAAQGGDPRLAEQPGLLPTAPVVGDLLAARSGYVQLVDAEEVGLIVSTLGAGRQRKGDQVDPTVGVVLRAKVGERVATGQPLLTVHARTPEALALASERLGRAVVVGDERPAPPTLIHGVLG